MVSLKNLKEKIVVLFFYPKDDTSGCTQEAVAFSDSLIKFKRADAVVLGVSRDNVAKHRKFKDKHGIKVTLLADEKGEVCEKYGVWVKKKLYGREYMGIERSTFLIFRGKIHKVWRKVKVAKHDKEVLEAVKSI